MMQQSGVKWRLAQWLEYKWWQNYLRKKSVTEYLDIKSSYWNKILDTIAPYVPLPGNQKIMDAGCGPAGIFMVLKENEVIAVDPLLDKYKSLPHFNIVDYPWVTFRNEPLENFDQKEIFDVIFCMNAINHVRDIERCYDHLIDALKPGGILVISTDCHRNDVVKKIFQLLPGDMLHPIQLNLKEYNEKLTTRGMKLVNTMTLKREAIFDYCITIAVKNKP
jgi:2-polyprenyl-3-methyl-5-hydroxy-6-metoxy-1,4-benzoquinol methylase